MEDRKALLDRLYTAFSRHDIDAVVATLHPDVDWPDVLAGARRHGRDDVHAYWTDQLKLIRPEVTPVAFAEQPDGRIAVQLLQIVHNLEGQIWSEGLVTHTYSFDDAGLITRMDLS